MDKRASGKARLLRWIVGFIGLALGMAVGAQGGATSATAKQGQQDVRALNPQPEVPSKPAPATTKSAEKSMQVATKPAEVTDPKQLNPQPEVPSKPKKKLPAKKPGTPPPKE